MPNRQTVTTDPAVTPDDGAQMAWSAAVGGLAQQGANVSEFLASGTVVVPVWARHAHVWACSCGGGAPGGSGGAVGKGADGRVLILWLP